MGIRCAALALCAVGCGGSGLGGLALRERADAGDEEIPSAVVATEDAELPIDAASPAIDSSSPGEAGGDEQASIVAEPEASSPQDASTPPGPICSCYGRAISCDLPCGEHYGTPDSGAAMDAFADAAAMSAPDVGPGEASVDSSPSAQCRESFVQQFAIGSYPPDSCPAKREVNGPIIDLCSLGTQAYVAICANIPDGGSASTQAALDCVSNCRATSWRVGSESAACFYDCWYPTICGSTPPGGCAADPTATPTNVPTGTFECLASSCFASF